MKSINSKNFKDNLTIKEKSSGKGTVILKYNSKQELEDYINKLK
jgi:hypothetical protein